MLKTSISFIWILICCIVSTTVLAQTPSILTISRNLQQPPKIDAKLDDAVWDNMQPHNFSIFKPNNGDTSKFVTKLGVTYDNEGIYISALLLDDNPDLIARELGLRDDDERNTDRFSIIIDTYNNGLNAFVFGVTAAGVQIDAYVTGDDFDENWDAVWDSDVEITEDGWVVEMKIPYSALRFPKKDVQSWGFNAYRVIKRINEESLWSHVDNSIDGFINQIGDLEGIKGIKPPLRLFFLPYLSTRYSKNEDGNQASKLTGGMDIKYGINESFTLDMSLIPDFSQVQSDDQVLNLSAFEVRFNERRSFFTEGTELFRKGNLFYSRRVGKSFGSVNTFSDYDEIISTPQNAPLINATKFSGRNKNGLGIGVFNGVTNKTYAEIKTPSDTLIYSIGEETGDRVYDNLISKQVEVDPVTNFNVLVVDQNLKNNSSIGIINTNVTRSNGGENANVTGLSLKFFDKENAYRISGFGALSALEEITDESAEINYGYKYFLSLGKVSGKYQYNIYRNIESDTYDVNDLGFLRSANEISHGARFSYNLFKPVWKLNRLRLNVRFSHDKLFNPNTFTSQELGFKGFFQFKNFWSAGFYSEVNIGDSFDYFEPRVDGMFLTNPQSRVADFWIESDERKALTINVNGGIWERKTWNQFDHWSGFELRYRVNNKLSFNYEFDYNHQKLSRGYVSVSDEIRLANDITEEVIFGARNITIITNVFTADYIFNNKMGVNFRVRHNWNDVSYKEFFYLDDDGSLLGMAYTGIDSDTGYNNHDKNFNAFNMDLQYKWQIAPGSFLSFNWKKSLVSSDNISGNTYYRNLKNTLNQNQTNLMSIKVTYFIDYLSLKRRA